MKAIHFKEPLLAPQFLGVAGFCCHGSCLSTSQGKVAMERFMMLIHSTTGYSALP